MATLESQRPLLKTDFSKSHLEAPPKHSSAKELAVVGASLVGYAAVVAGAALWWPTLPVLAAGTVGAGVMGALRRRGAIVPVPVLPIAAGSVTHHGIAHRLTETVHSVTDRPVVLAEQALVHNRHGVLFRRVRAVPFVVEIEGGDKVVIDGVLRVEMPELDRYPVKAGDPRLVALGIDGVPVRGELDVALVREGDRITVRGDETTEIVPEMAFHRDGGEARVMRGRAGAVVAIAPATP